MTLENYIAALTHIDGLLWQIIGAMKAEQAKSQTQNNAGIVLPALPNLDNLIPKAEVVTQIEEENEMYHYSQGTVIKRADGRYEAKLYIAGKQKSISCKKRKKDVVADLNKAIEQKEANKLTHKQQKIEKSTYSFFGWLDNFYEKYKKDKIKSHGNIERTIRLHIKPYAEDRSLKSITLEYLENIILAEKSTRAQEDIYKLFKEAFKKAKKLNYIKENITEDLEDPKHEREPGTARTEAELKEFFNIVAKYKEGQKYLRIFKLYLFTGCRASELFRIYGHHLNFKQNTLFIDGTKNKVSKRIIPIFSAIKDIIKDIKIEPNRKLFDDSYSAVKSFMKRLKKDNPQIKVKVKDLRTTFGTMLAQKGVAENVLAKWMGHAKVETTRKYYIKILSDYEQHQSHKIDTIDPNNLNFDPI